MADNKITLIAELSVTDSVNAINESIDAIQKDSKLKPLKINAILDDDSIKDIKSKLSSVSENIEIKKISIDNSQISGELSQNINRIQSKLQSAVSFDKAINTNSINEFAKQIEDLKVKGVNIDELKTRFKNLNIAIDKIVPTFTELKNSSKHLTQLTVTGKDAFGRLVNYTETFNAKNGQLIKNTTKVTESLGKIEAAQKRVKVETDNAQKAYNSFLTLKGKFELYSKQYGDNDDLKSSFQSIQNLINSFDRSQPIDKQRESLIQLDSALKLIKADIDKINSATNAVVKTENDYSTKQLLLQQSYDTLYEKIKKTKLSIDEIGTREGINYNQVFNDIMSKNIVDEKTLSRAREALKVIDNEFKILNAQTASKLPENSIENIAQKLTKLDSQIKIIKSDFDKLSIAPSDLKDKFAELERITKGFDFSPDIKIASKEEITEKIKGYTAIENLVTNIQSQLKVAQKAEKEINSSIKTLNDLSNSKLLKDNTSNTEVQAQLTSIEKLKQAYVELQEKLANPESPETLARLSKELESLKPEFDKVVKGSEELNNSLKDNESMARFNAKLNNLTNQIENFASVNKKATSSLKTMRNGMTFADEWQRMLNLLKSGNLDNNALQRLIEDFRNFKGEAKSAGLVTSKFFTDMASQLRTVVQRWVSWYAAANYIKAMINEVITLDTAMTNLKKVTDETEETYEKFIDAAKEQSKALHGTTSDVIEQTSEWAKLGYTIEEAQKLTSTSMVYAKVGEVDNKTAVSDIVTAMKAYNIEAENAITIVDRFNKLGNEFSVGSKELGEGLNRSASALAVAGNDISQSLALITGGAEITQNAKETGDAIKIISLRLRGMKGALEELNEEAEGIESISKVQTQILNLTNNRVNIFKDDGSFKSTYDILKEVSKIYNDLTETNKASLTEVMFGKNRANQGLAILQAFQSGQIEKAYLAAENSANSAITEFDKMSKSIETHIQDFKNAFQSLSDTVVDSDFLKEVIDIGTNIVNLFDKTIDKIGMMPTLLGGLLFGLAVKKGNVFQVIHDLASGAVTKIAAIGKSWKQTETTINSTNVAGINATNTALEATEAAATGAKIAVTLLNVAINLLTTVAISLLIKGVTKLANAKKEAAEKAEEAREQAIKTFGTYESESATLDSLSQQYIELANSTSDLAENKEKLLSIQGEINKGISDEREQVDLLNNSIAENIELIEKQKLNAAQDVVRQTQGDYDLAVKELQEEYLKFVNVKGSKGYGFGSRELESLRGLLKESDINQWFQQSDNEKYSLYIAGTLEEQKEALSQILKAYGQIENYDEEKYNNLVKQYDEIDKQITQYDSIIASYESAEKTIAELQDKGLRDQFNSAVEAVTEAQKTLAQLREQGASKVEIKKAEDSYDKLKSKLFEVAGANSELRDIALDTVNAVETSVTGTTTTVSAVTSDFEEEMDGAFKTVTDNVTKIKKAMQSLAEGETLDWSDVQEIVWKIDDSGVIKSIDEVNGAWTMSIEELIKLKDEDINAEIKRQEAIRATAQLGLQETQSQIAELQRKLLYNNSASAAQTGSQLQRQLSQLNDEATEYERTLYRSDLAIRSLNSNLGNTIDKTKVLENAQKKVTAAQKQLDSDYKRLTKDIDAQISAVEKQREAVENQMQSQIDAAEKEKEILEEQKTALEEQLAIYEKQKEEVESIIANYEKTADVIEKFVNGEVSSIESERDKQEKLYNDRIEAIKNANDEAEKQNELAEKQLELQKKARDLENSYKEKTRVYTQGRGWHYESDAETVANASEAYQNAQKDYNKAVADKQREDTIKELEAERDSVIRSYDDQIEAYNKYLEEWQDMLSEQEDSENELLAQQLLGVDWREKISEKDMNVLTKYRNDYNTYKNKLKVIVNDEIATLNNSIDAKNKEISAKQKQIDTLNQQKEDISKIYQDEVTALNNQKNEMNAIYQDQKEKLDNYITELTNSVNGEKTELDNRITNWSNYRDEWNKIADDVIATSQAVNAATQSKSTDVVEEIINIKNSDENALQKAKRLMELARRGYSEGGTIDYTGYAAVHGSKQRSETVFNANDSAKLYDMVHNSPNIIADMMNKAFKLANPNISNSNSYSTNSASVVINGGLNLNGVNDYNSFVRYMNRYVKGVITENKVARPI